MILGWILGRIDYVGPPKSWEIIKMLWLLPQDRLVCVSENSDLSRPCKKNYLDELGGASYYTTQHSITLPVVNYHSSQFLEAVT